MTADGNAPFDPPDVDVGTPVVVMVVVARSQTHRERQEGHPRTLGVAVVRVPWMGANVRSVVMTRVMVVVVGRFVMGIPAQEKNPLSGSRAHERVVHRDRQEEGFPE